MKNYFVLAFLLLTSCAANPQRVAQENSLREQRMQAYYERLRQTCIQYGIQRDTPQMSQCVMQLDQNVELEANIANRMAQQQREAEALRNAQTPITAPNQRR